MKQVVDQENFQKTEEINLMQVIQFIWEAKVWIASSILVALLLVYVFVVIKPIKADTYHVTQSVEIATLQIKSEYRTTGPFSVERSRDVVKILPSMVDSSMQITVPNAADKVILLSIVSTDKEKALTQISEAVNLLKERHGRMISIMKDTKIINPTSALNEPKVVFIPFKNKLTKLMVFGVVMGGVFGLIISLLVRLIRAQREK